MLGASLFQWKLDNGAENSVFGYEKLARISELKEHWESGGSGMEKQELNGREENEQRLGDNGTE